MLSKVGSHNKGVGKKFSQWVKEEKGRLVKLEVPSLRSPLCPESRNNGGTSRKSRSSNQHALTLHAPRGGFAKQVPTTQAWKEAQGYIYIFITSVCGKN